MNYIAEERVAPHGRTTIYNALSDLRHLENLGELLSSEGVNLSVIDSERCEIAIPMGGTLQLYFKEKHPEERLVLASAPSPLPVSFELTVLLREIDEASTGIACQMEADMPAFVQAMAGGSIKKGVDRLADVFAKIPYDNLQ